MAPMIGVFDRRIIVLTVGGDTLANAFHVAPPEGTASPARHLDGDDAGHVVDEGACRICRLLF
jgi:hypothetical protein